MAPDVRLLARREAIPDIRAVDRDRLVRQLLRVLGIEVLRPVDARVRVPLEVLRLLIEANERVARVVV